jgi:hypothetical protein
MHEMKNSEPPVVDRLGLVVQTTLAFFASIGYFAILGASQRWLILPADLGLLDCILPWIPVFIFFFIIRRAPRRLERWCGEREA